MRQVSFALRDNKIMPQGKNSGSLKLTVTTKGRRNWGCVHPQSYFRKHGIELCTPRFSYLPPPLPPVLFWSVMLYHLVTHSVFDDKKWVKLVFCNSEIRVCIAFGHVSNLIFATLFYQNVKNILAILSFLLFIHVKNVDKSKWFFFV